MRFSSQTEKEAAELVTNFAIVESTFDWRTVELGLKESLWTQIDNEKRKTPDILTICGEQFPSWRVSRRLWSGVDIFDCNILHKRSRKSYQLGAYYRLIDYSEAKSGNTPR